MIIKRKSIIRITLLFFVLLLGQQTVKGATFNDINQSGIFVKQQQSDTCTLASAVMLVRRAALATGNSNWSSITESSMRSTAWKEGAGLWYSFSYAGITVSHASLSGTSQLISLLNAHPEGIIIYNTSRPHAILATDYTNGTFYCADPANNIAAGRIPISAASITAESCSEYWYVSSPKITINNITDSENPTGYLDAAASTDKGGTVYVNGWSYDPDKKSQSLQMHIYIGGPAGDPNAEKQVITANKQRDDVNTTTGAGANHGFEEYLDTLMYGDKQIYVYAINIKSDGSNSETGNNPQMKNSPKTVTIPEPTKDNLAPSATLTFDGNTYERYDKAMTWDQAKAFCETKGGHLVTITSSFENNAVADFAAAGSKNFYLMGGIDRNDNGTWEWVTGESFSYTNWDPQSGTEGFESGQQCACIIGKDNPPNKQKGEWIDNPKNQQEKYKHTNYYHQLNCGFICEYDKGVAFDTTAHYALTDTGANIRTWVSNNNANNLSSIGFKIGTDQTNLTSYELAANKTWTRFYLDTYVCDHVESLRSGTTYYYCFYVKLSNGEEFCSTIKNFKTQDVLAEIPDSVLSNPSASIEYNGNIYYRFDYATPHWEQAKRACEKMGGNLVTITSAQEQEVLSQLVNGGSQQAYWIGGNDRTTEGTWRWVTGENWEYTNWISPQPDDWNNEEDYASIRKADSCWNDTGELVTVDGTSEGRYGFICECSACDHQITYSVTTEPTLTSAGKLSGICSICGKAKEIVLPALNDSDYRYAVKKASTCQKTGTATYTWEEPNGQSFTFEGQIEKIDHDYVATQNPPTCIDNGSTTYTCSMCGDTYTERVPITEPSDEEGWTTEKPSGVSEDMIHTKTQYRYSDYQTKDSYDTSMTGWTQKSSRWEKNGGGTIQYVQSWPAGFSTSHNLYGTYNKSAISASETATAKTTINSNSVTGYLYYHWCRNNYSAGPINRATSKTWTSEFNTFHAFYSTTNPGGLTASPDGDGSRTYANGSVCKDSHWYYNVPVYSQSYSTYRKLFTYERWTDWSGWSDTQVTASSTKKVETRTLYKYDVDRDNRHVWGEPEYTWDETTNALTAEYHCTMDASHEKTEVIENVSVMKLPTGTKVIEEEAFSGIASQVVIIPDGCTTIGSKAFADCPNLLYVKIPESVTEIAEDAFSSCVKLTGYH